MCSQFLAITFLLILSGYTIIQCSAVTWTTQFNPETITIYMGTIGSVNLTIEGLSYNDLSNKGSELIVRCDKEQLAMVDKRIKPSEISLNGSWSGSFDIEAIFLGTPNVYVEQVNTDNTIDRSDEVLPVIIIRKNRVIDNVFTASVAALVSILYINFGAALDLDKLKGIVVRPIGPAIGFFGQFVIMPVLSYFCGILIFPNNVEMQLGMFFTGASPGGGASNIWTVILGGNLDLSIIMTTIGTLAAFGMMPIWLFTLGKVIFDRGNLVVPYQNLITYVIALIIPLTIGMLIRRFLPRIGMFLVKVLKPVSIALIMFIVIFGIVTNLYLFQLFSWEIIIAGLCLPWFSYVLAWSVAKLFRQNAADALTIALETGIQNTGIAVFILRFSLGQPQADLTTIIPVSVSLMTPVPLICLFIYQRISQWMARRKVISPIPVIKANNAVAKEPIYVSNNDLIPYT